MNNDRHQAKYIPFRCSQKTGKLIEDMAKQQNRPKAEILRDLVDKGLLASGAMGEDEYLNSIVKASLNEIISPHIERLASICAKTTQISSAAFFMSIWGAARDGSAEDQQSIMEAAAEARRLGIEYLKLAKDRDLDTFIKEGAKQIMDE